MHVRSTIVVLGWAWLLSTPGSLFSVQQEKTKSATVDVSSFKKQSGFFPFDWDPGQGKLWLRLKSFNQPFLYVTSLASGLGSNPVGLDRGQLGSTRVVQFLKIGPKVFLQQLNLKYRASSSSRLEKLAVQDSFASSILWSGKLQVGSDGASLVDITSLVVRDAHGCVGKLSANGQGNYSFDRDRSFVYLPRTKAFPRNCEFEATITLSSSKPGSLAERTAASGKAITLRQHHSFVQLPDDEFKPRKFDPRSGCFSVGFADYSVPIQANIEKKYVTRHRLFKKDPQAQRSPAVQPITYYVDGGVPSPIREALLDGARWWNEAFESAGFIDAFEVKMLPEGADPMDVRYNVIQWVHRATRGWSYGQSVVDPRTGEIIKGHVLLGSLRVRQDFLLMQGLSHEKLARSRSQNACSCCQQFAAPAGPLARFLSPEKSLEVALARIRQLSAHEVGHTLGFAHNFAASTYDDRASVMDYPAPRAKIVDGKINLEDAYGVGIGSWDKFTVQYAYSQFNPGSNEQEELQKLVAGAIQQKMIYVTDADARPSGAAHPLGNLWDNGSDPVESLQHELNVRQMALDQFNEKLVPPGEPMSELEKMFVPVYLHHRYQVEATAKLIGGVHYRYAVSGDGQARNQPVPPQRQKQALSILLSTLDPFFLSVPAEISRLLSPASYRSASDRERFSSRTSPLFDSETAIEVAADLTISSILQSQRLARVAALNANDWNVLAVLNGLSERVFQSPDDETAEDRRTRRIVQGVLVDRLIRLAGSRLSAMDVNSATHHFVTGLRAKLAERANKTPGKTVQQAHLVNLVKKIDRYLLSRGPTVTPRNLSDAPPGSPIGDR